MIGMDPDLDPLVFFDEVIADLEDQLNEYFTSGYVRSMVCYNDKMVIVTNGWDVPVITEYDEELDQWGDLQPITLIGEGAEAAAQAHHLLTCIPEAVQ